MPIKKDQTPIIEPKNVWVGSPQAPISLVLWGEYENEACAHAHEIVKKLLAEYDGKIRFNFRHFPLTQIHQRSMKAAEASLAAAQHGKFAEMHDMLFANRRQLGTISLRLYARDIGIKDKNFLNRLMDSYFSWPIRSDLLEGLDKGIRSVPVFFINGQRHMGRITLNELRKAIDAAMPSKKKQRA